MADAISMQELIDARTDAKTLEEAVNGDAVTTVLSRLGETYPTLSNALNQIDSKLDSADAQIKQGITDLFENGGLPATPFATKALMTASALIDGDYAMVTEDTVNNGLYIKTAGAWVKSAYDSYDIKTAKSLTIGGTEVSESTENTWDVKDSNGKVALAVNEDGETVAARLLADALAIGGTEISESLSKALDFKDKNGQSAIALSPSGAFQVGRLESEDIVYQGNQLSSLLNDTQTSTGGLADNYVLKPSNNYPANLNHFEIYGQSLSQGALSTPIQTTTQPYDSLMFSGGIRPQHPSYSVADFYADFIPLIEASANDGYPGYETPCGGATESLKQLIFEENNVAHTDQEYKLLGSASGTGGSTIAQLSTTYFDSHLAPTITAAYNLAQAKGMTYTMPYIGWVQGENDNKLSGISIEAYKTAMQALIAKIDAHLKSLHPELGLKGFISTQLASFTTTSRPTPHIELALYEAAMAANSNVFLACPLYIFDYMDHFHVDGVSSKWMGAYIGLVYKRLVVDQVGWKHIHPISHTKQGRILEVKYHVPVQPLVVDTVQVYENTNYGFTLVDSAGADIPITSVTVTQGDTIRFTTAATIPANVELRYAYTPNTPTPSGTVGKLGRKTGARGNIRDSQGNDIVFDPTGINKPLHNWTPIHYYKVK